MEEVVEESGVVLDTRREGCIVLEKTYAWLLRIVPALRRRTEQTLLTPFLELYAFEKPEGFVVLVKPFAQLSTLIPFSMFPHDFRVYMCDCVGRKHSKQWFLQIGRLRNWSHALVFSHFVENLSADTLTGLA